MVNLALLLYPLSELVSVGHMHIVCSQRCHVVCFCGPCGKSDRQLMVVSSNWKQSRLWQGSSLSPHHVQCSCQVHTK